jgi:hypothetical protein
LSTALLVEGAGGASRRPRSAIEWIRARVERGRDDHWGE